MSWNRSRETKRRLRKLSRETSGIIKGVWYDSDKGRYVRIYYASKYKKWLRVKANRKVRRTKDVPNISGYRKIYNYWWELF
mgnify:CR=1 FL=1